MQEETLPLAPEYQFYVPAPGRTVITGSDEHEVQLPQLPLPVESSDKEAAGEEPSDKEIGVGIYNYLRRFPDCPYAQDYARLMQTAYPYYLTDLGSQIIMLETKDVDAPYIRRKINYLKILLLLEPENPQLLQKIGIACFELAMIYTELIHVRRELSHALSYLQRSLRLVSNDTATMNVLGQICYLMGDYSAVLRYWQGVVDLLPASDARTALLDRLDAISANEVPTHPLIDDLESIGVAMEHFAANEFDASAEIMDRLEEENVIPSLLPSPEFYYFLGICREKVGSDAAAFEAFSRALEIDPDHEAAQQGIDRVQNQPA